MTHLPARPSPRPRTPSPPVERPSSPPQRSFEQWYPEPIYAEKPEQIERNVVIMVFVAFVAGLLLGKIMNPVILKH